MIAGSLHRTTCVREELWSEEELGILKENYPIMGSKVATLLRKRSASACKAKAIILGIRYKDHSDNWTKEEDKI